MKEDQACMQRNHDLKNPAPGTSAVAVLKAGQGRTFVGCEIDEVYANVFRRRFAAGFVGMTDKLE
jgi:hypothetical protein